MQQQAVRKTYKYKLNPTTKQARELGRVLGLCRSLYNTALEQRIIAYQRRRVSVSRFQQEAELKDIRAEMPEYAAIHSHVLQDVLARLDKTYQAFFRRLIAREKAGFPRYQGRDRYHSFTYKEFGNGATLDNGFLVLSKIGRIAVRWSRPVEGTPKTVTISREADGWYVCFSCADAARIDAPCHWTGDGHRPGDRGLRDPVQWHAHLLSGLVSQSRTSAQDCPTARLASQEGQQPPEESGQVARQGASESAPPTSGLSPQDVARPRVRQ
jgi:hypothetical protein